MSDSLTKSFCESAKPDTEKLKIFFDRKIPGFGLAVFPTGQKSFILQYRNVEGKQRRFTLGKLSDSLTLAQARERATELHRRILNGEDPQEFKQERRGAITVNTLIDDYLASEKFAGKSPTTQATDRGRITRHIRPLVGSVVADRLKTEAVRRMKADITAGKTALTEKTGVRGKARVSGGSGTATKAVLLLRAIYAWGISEGSLTTNPCAGVTVDPSNRRETTISDPQDYARLFTTLERMESEHRLRPAVADAVRVLALTGARRGEIANLKWKHVDLRTGRITLPREAHKSGRKTGENRTIALASVVQEIISRQPAGEPDDFVFKPAKGKGSLALGKPWRNIRAEAGLPADLVLHGLRHSVATTLADSGASNVELMQALGHKQVSTTTRYIHAVEQARSTLAERAASVALAGLAESKGLPKAEVVPLKKA